MKNILLLSGVLLLCACSTEQLSDETTSSKLGDANYEIQIPQVPYIKKIDDGDVAATSMPDDMLQEKDWRIELYERHSCPPLGIDSPQSMPVGGDEALWGRVDYYDVNRAYDIFSEQPFCIPPVINDDFCGEAGVFTEQQKREYQECIRKREERKRSPSGAYAFCAEKQGKAVAICIRQQTDNPQLAEDIFKTFRWTN